MNQDVLRTDKLTILIVENSRTARELLQKQLVDAHFNVIATATGPEAIEVLEKHKINGIVMDIYMPLLNGYEVANRIRLSNKQYSILPIIAYTASTNPRDETQCLEAGMNAVIIKQNDSINLLSYLSNYFGEADPDAMG